MTSDILFFIAINCAFWAIVLLFFVWGLSAAENFSNDVHQRFDEWVEAKEREELGKSIEAGDYWDGEDVNYDTGEIGADARASVRHPKNRDRAYSGSVERFHDGGW